MMALAMGAAIVPPWNSLPLGWFSTKYSHSDLGVRDGRESCEPGLDVRPARFGRPRFTRHLHAGDAGRHPGAVRAVHHREHQIGDVVGGGRGGGPEPGIGL